MAQLKAASTGTTSATASSPTSSASSGLSPTSAAATRKKIRVFNTSTKEGSQANAHNHTPGDSPASSEPDSPADPISGSRPPSASFSSPRAAATTTDDFDIFDEADEDSRQHSNGHRKRKSPSYDDEVTSPREPAPAPKRAKKWTTTSQRNQPTSTPAEIQALVENHRSLKRMTDKSLQQSQHDYSLLDNYLTASLGFFKAAALYESLARSQAEAAEGQTGAHASAADSQQSLGRALELYKGLVSNPLKDTPSLLSYYISRCNDAKLKLRIVLGQRCIAMAHGRLWLLQQKQLYTSYMATLQRAANQDSVSVPTKSLADLADIFRFGEYHSRSETEAAKHPQVFSPYPSHPFDLDPFDFLDFIEQEVKAVQAAESTEGVAQKSKKSR